MQQRWEEKTGERHNERPWGEGELSGRRRDEGFVCEPEPERGERDDGLRWRLELEWC